MVLTLLQISVDNEDSYKSFNNHLNSGFLSLCAPHTLRVHMGFDVMQEGAGQRASRFKCLVSSTACTPVPPTLGWGVPATGQF